ncbi:MAG: immunity 52 family protein [Rhodobacteraceae bacterium]|nr:immunity 52 family protein [Paracoccaceae bacterium]
MNITLTCATPSVSLTPVQVYEQAASCISRLSLVHPDLRSWWKLPDAPNVPFVDFHDSHAILSFIKAMSAKHRAEFPMLADRGSTGLMLTNASSELQWRERGRITLSVQPAMGEVTFSVYGAERVLAPVGEVVWSLLKALSSDSRVTYAKTDVHERVDGRSLVYSMHRGVYPHREFLGWMGYVDQALLPAQLPEASRVERLGEGTLILATDLLDLSSSAAVEQVNRVEIRLAELGLLPVTDPRLS